MSQKIKRQISKRENINEASKNENYELKTFKTIKLLERKKI